MALQHLDIERFRCISTARLEFSSERNLIVGENASGKTSILEAIFLLGTGHSFRTHATNALIQDGSDHFLVVGRIIDAAGQSVIGFRGTQDAKECRVGGQPATGSENLARRFPVQVIDPEVHRLLEDGPIRRRRFLDWGVFHVEQQFYDAWKRYNRALRQRNAALRAKSFINGQLVWDEELTIHGSIVDALRERYVDTLRPFVTSIGRRLLGMEVALEYHQGWRRHLYLAEALKEALPRDRLRGVTSVGPHRADVVLRIDGQSTKDRISRGQQKMLACVLMLAQQFERAAVSSTTVSLLLDDPAAELDINNLGKLLEIVAELPVQLIVSALSPAILSVFNDAKVFHVEHGIVKGMA